MNTIRLCGVKREQGGAIRTILLEVQAIRQLAMPAQRMLLQCPRGRSLPPRSTDGRPMAAGAGHPASILGFCGDFLVDCSHEDSLIRCSSSSPPCRVRPDSRRYLSLSLSRASPVSRCSCVPAPASARCSVRSGPRPGRPNCERDYGYDYDVAYNCGYGYDYSCGYNNYC